MMPEEQIPVEADRTALGCRLGNSYSSRHPGFTVERNMSEVSATDVERDHRRSPELDDRGTPTRVRRHDTSGDPGGSPPPFVLPLPAGVGICLECQWMTSDGDELAVARHTRGMGHITVYRPDETGPTSTTAAEG